jgi:hypothetical protein
MSEGGLTAVLSLITELLSLCSNRPDLGQVASVRLDGMIAKIAPRTQPKKIAEDAIHNHISQVGRHAGIHLSFPTRNALKPMAEQLAKRHSLPFNSQELKNKDQVLDWLGRNWEIVQESFFRMMDQTNRIEAKRP